MNVSVSYKAYIHTHHEDYKDVEWVRINKENILFKVDAKTTHVIPIKHLISFSVTQ